MQIIANSTAEAWEVGVWVPSGESDLLVIEAWPELPALLAGGRLFLLRVH